MATVAANGITIHFDNEGSGEPLVLIGILPWSFTPKLYTERPEFVDMVSAILRGGTTLDFLLLQR